MPPLNSLDTWSSRNEWKVEKPKSKCFLIGEGANTEYWYFDSLATRLAKEGKPELIELKPVERTEREKNQSSPRKLLEHAVAVINGRANGGEFIKDTDRVVVVFDVDVFKDDPDGYATLLADFRAARIEVAVTYPSFELYLMLHKRGALEATILPHRQEIEENGHAPGSRRRFIEKLASDELGMNPKTNHHIGDLAANFETALVAETKLNQNPDLAVGRLTSNVAKTIKGVIEDGAIDL